MSDSPDDELIRAVADNISIAGVIRSLGRAIAGPSYRLIRTEVKRLSLDTAHWKGKAHATTKPQRKFSRKDLVADSDIPTSRIKKIVLREGLITYTCNICRCGPEWNGKPLVLRLDHIDGIRDNHSLGNLRFLCPNCDSQTSTYCGRNKTRVVVKRCPCGKKAKTGCCITCSNKNKNQDTKIIWPSTEEILKEVKDTSYRELSRKLGVSDNAIRKHLRSRPLVVEGGRL